MDEAGGEDEVGSMTEVSTWWAPLTRVTFHDPEQESPVYRPRNHVRVQLPHPGIWFTAFRFMAEGVCGVFLSGKKTEFPKCWIRSTRSVSRLWGSFQMERRNVTKWPRRVRAMPATLSWRTSRLMMRAENGWRNR